jgi:hypothetical protein
MKAPVTRTKEGGCLRSSKSTDRVKEGGAFITVLHGAGEVRHGANDVAARAEAAALPAHCGRKKKGLAQGRVGWLGLPGRSGLGGWLGLPGRSGPGGLARPLGRLARKLKKISFPIKLNF